MKDLTLVEQVQVSDCDILIGKAENTIYSLENCFNTIIDEKKTKLNVVGSIFSFAFSLSKLTFNVAGCAIKNTPKAIVAVAAVKREILTDIENEWSDYQKELQKEALEIKIERLALEKKHQKRLRDFDEIFS